MALIRIELECHSNDINEVLENMKRAYKECPVGIHSYVTEIVNKKY